MTGAQGFLGGYVLEALEAQGAELIPLAQEEYNLLEQQQVRALFLEHRPQLLIHLAAAVGGIGANVANPGRFLYENALMGLLLLEEARQADTELLLISTTCSYPKDAPLPLREESIWSGPPVGATGPYGVAKRMLHEAILHYDRQYSTGGKVLILSNLYGPRDHFEEENAHVIPALIRRFVEAQERGLSEVVNWGTGQPTREFIHVRDAARAITLAAASPDLGPAPVNIGTGVETSIAELTELIAALVGYQGSLRWDHSKPDGQPRRYLEVSKARAFGFEAQILLKEGLEESIRWYRSQRP